MPDTLTELNETLICSRLSDVTSRKTAWILLQEPGFIGFGVVQSNGICWPPNVQPDWTRVSDLRLFGEAGEWHIWPHWDETWQSRLLKSECMTAAHALTEYHVLWGNQLKHGTPPWVALAEERGAEIWLPLASELNCRNPPLCLKLKQVIDYDPESALAGIVDAALVALVGKSPQDKVWTPLSPPHVNPAP